MALLPLLVPLCLVLSQPQVLPDETAPVPLTEVMVDPLTELFNARRLARELRYEEAVVEYQRYLGHAGSPRPERARALLELGLVHLLLEDSVSARARLEEALTLDPDVEAPAGSPPKHVAWVQEVRETLLTRPELSLLPRNPEAPSAQVRVALKDPRQQTREVLLRYAPVPEGPYLSEPLRCTAAACEGRVPMPAHAKAFTAWYFLEALDAEGHTLARAASPTQPLQLSVMAPRPWYENPWVYGGGAAVLVGAAAVFFAVQSSR